MNDPSFFPGSKTAFEHVAAEVFISAVRSYIEEPETVDEIDEPVVI